MIKRRCYGCLASKALSEFYKDKNRKYGYSYICKQCQINYHGTHRQKISSRKKQWRKDNQLKIKEHRAQFYQENKTRLDARSKKYYQINKLDILRRVSEWSKEYRKKNNKQIKVRQRKWRQSDQGKASRCMSKSKRRALIASCEINDLTSTQIKSSLIGAIICGICKRGFNNARRKSVDHIIPISNGGINSISNIQIVCLPCNQSKGAEIADHHIIGK